jgi:hypothetical protein
MRPLTGKPDAGKLPVRFGGRGKVNPLFLPLSNHRSPGFSRFLVPLAAKMRIAGSNDTVQVCPIQTVC